MFETFCKREDKRNILNAVCEQATLSPPLQSEGGEFLFVLKFNILSTSAFESLHACASLSSSDTFHFCASLAVKIFNLFSLGPSCHFSKQYKARYSAC